MTFEARPMCILTQCTALWKRDISMKIDKASNIDGFNILFHFIFIPICILKIKLNLLNLCLIVYS